MFVSKKHLKQFLIILLFAYVLLLVINRDYISLSDPKGMVKQFLAVFSYTFGIYMANSLVLSDYYLKRKKNAINLLVGALFVNLLTLLVVTTIEFLSYYFLIHSSVQAASTHLKNLSLGTVLFSMFVTTVVYVVLVARRKDAIDLKTHQESAHQAISSFESLKNQLDPHFLFNSLSVLTALIEENPEKAQKFTIALSKIYRYVLDQKDKNWVEVNEELHFARLYMLLMQMRFEKGLSITYPEENECAQFQMIPLSLQLVLENVIKHNIVSEQEPMHIVIEIKNDEIIVQNTLQRKTHFKSSQGVGLENIRQRYALLTTRKMSVQLTDQWYIVRLPLLQVHSN